MEDCLSGVALGHQCDCHQDGLLWAATGHSLVVVKRSKRKQVGKRREIMETGAQLGGSGAAAAAVVDAVCIQ